MQALVSAINCFMSAIQYAINLATKPAIKDPFITWAFAVPSIISFISAIIFWFTFKHLDKEEYIVSNNDDYQLNSQSSRVSDEGV
jgi:hypothetical protein